MAQITLTQGVERQLKELVPSAFVSEDAFGVVDTIDKGTITRRNKAVSKMSKGI